MTTPTSPEVILFNYTLKDNRGNMIESTDQQPIRIVAGQNQVLPAVEAALVALAIGESQQLLVKSADAYGDYNDELVMQVPSSEFPDEPALGEVFNVKLSEELNLDMRVADHKQGFVILDGNHPLAGMDLMFDLEVTDRQPAQSADLIDLN